ncbi:MAG: ATP-binding protein [Ferruginibacter sp.]
MNIFSVYIYSAVNRTKLTIIILCCLFIILRGTILCAQSQKGYESISIAQGLSQGMVFDILQDQDGFIWVATKNGLNRYDGYDFKVFTNDPYNNHTLSSNTIIKLFEDSKRRIWAGTENGGVNIYDKKSGKFYRMANNPSDANTISGNRIRTIAEMPDGRILLGADGDGLNIVEITNDFFEKESAPVIKRLSLPANEQVYGMGTDKNGVIWVGGMAGSVYRLDPLNNNFIELANGKLFNSGYLKRDGSVLINGNLFLSDGKDVYPLFDTKRILPGNIILNPKKELWENYHRDADHYDISKWEPGNIIKWNVPLPATKIDYPFMIDRSGVLWTGSLGYGLRKYNTSSSKFNAILEGQSVRWIVPVSNDDIFLGDFGFAWYRLKNDSIHNNPFSKIPSVTEIDNFIISKTGDYWIKSDNTGYFRYNPVSGKLTGYSDTNYHEVKGNKQPILEDKKGNIWFPAMGGKLIRINPVSNKIDSFNINTDASRVPFLKAACTALYQDNENTLWIGTSEGFAKLVFRNIEDSRPLVKWFYNNINNRNSLGYNSISCFANDPAEPDKYLWICTKGGGLNRMNKLSGDFLQLTITDGLPDNVVYGILPDDAGNLWGSTNRGIFCLSAIKEKDTTRWVFRNFTKAYGLQDDEFNTGAYTKLPNGNLAFGGVNGMNIFDPREILASSFLPNVFITNIMVNNSRVTADDKTGILQGNVEETKNITLSYLQDILTLEFSSLDFTAPNQNKYRYQLEGADKDWIESGSRRTATYLHLPSGSYTFKVQGSNSQGIWSNKIAALHIKVLPPWWRSWWAYACYALILAFCIRAYFKFSVNRAKLKSQLTFEQVEAKRMKEIDGLKTQLYTNITHEFRTPLTVILGMANQVVNNPKEHLNNGMNMIIRNGESLLKLVNEMLDLSKLETGKMTLKLVQGDIISFLRYIVESFNSLAESQQKQLHFLSQIDTLVTPYDPEKMRQIIANLLSNALKFTPEKGNIYISISEEKQTNLTTTSLVIKVKDTGIGIPEGQLQNIFDRFYQLDNSHTRKMEGTGIGLALTKELVKLMEGEITVKSPPTGANKGSEFTVSIPVKKIMIAEEDLDYTSLKDMPQQKITNNIEHRVEMLAEPASNGKSLILLVEDNADVVAYTASCLPDYRLAVGKDGREGFEIATDIIPDLIITDIMMPFVDGFEMCRRLRKDERTSHIPIIMLTAKADIESRIEGLEQGADAYLQKPFHKDELLVRIKKLLELRKSLQQYYIKRSGLAVMNTGIIATAADELVPASNVAEDEFVKKIRSAVEEHLTDVDFSVEQLCKYVFMSHSQLHRKLDALTGYSPNKFIRVIRLNRAKELLRNSSDSIASIALDCGYNDPGYFARVFKQEYNVTPLEWRGKNH